MQKNSITNKITPCCSLPFGVVYWWVSHLNLNTEADRQFIISKISQSGTISIDAWKVLINSGELEADAALTKNEFLAWFDCDRPPSCSQLKLIIEGFKLGNYNPLDEYGVGWTEISTFEEYNAKVIKKVVNYVGGVGSIPTDLNSNINKYYAKTGGFTLNKDLATDFKPDIPTDTVIEIAHSTTISFLNKKAISKVTLSSNINYTYSKNNALLNSYEIHEIIPNGKTITFSNDFTVQEQSGIDYTKPIEIMFHRPLTPTLKPLAIVVNLSDVDTSTAAKRYKVLSPSGDTINTWFEWFEFLTHTVTNSDSVYNIGIFNYQGVNYVTGNFSPIGQGAAGRWANLTVAESDWLPNTIYEANGAGIAGVRFKTGSVKPNTLIQANTNDYLLVEI